MLGGERRRRACRDIMRLKTISLKKLAFEQCNSVFLRTMQKYAGEYLILLINEK